MVTIKTVYYEKSYIIRSFSPDIALRTGKCTGTISFENTSYRTNLDGWRLVSFR
jgi:hypothetical protein